MAGSVFSINKGINKPIEFKGLKAQYIWYLGGVILVLLVSFAILYILGVHPVFSLFIVGLLGTLGCGKVYHMSARYGAHGLMKKMARRRVPKLLKIYSRYCFFYLP